MVGRKKRKKGGYISLGTEQQFWRALAREMMRLCTHASMLAFAATHTYPG